MYDVAYHEEQTIMGFPLAFSGKDEKIPILPQQVCNWSEANT